MVVRGLASLYEFLNTSKDGESTIGTDKRPINPAFSKIVVFEQKINLVEFGLNLIIKEYDFEIPPQDILNTENYNDPFIIRPKMKYLMGFKNQVKKIQSLLKRINYKMNWNGKKWNLSIFIHKYSCKIYKI